MKKSLFIAISFFVSSTAIANDTHKIGFGVNYHLDQDSAPGYNFNYQWQFGESFEFEARYLASNDLEVTNNEGSVLGDYSQFSIGANFIKQYNDNLSIKAGTGLGVITTSSNDFLVEKQAMSPYLMLAANYKINEQIAIELGQYSHFNSEALETNHSIYLNAVFLFGQTTSAYRPVEASQQLRVASATPNPEKQNTPPVDMPKKETAPIAQVTNQSWYVQLGAYLNHANGNQALNKVNSSLTSFQMQLIKDNRYYRLVSPAFSTKQRADDFADMLNSQYSIQGYVKQIMFE